MTSRPELSRPAKGVAIFCLLAFLATMWPVYPLFSRVFPLFLGMPFALVYLVTILVTVFFVMLGLYLWENAKGELD